MAGVAQPVEEGPGGERGGEGGHQSLGARLLVMTTDRPRRSETSP